MAHVVTCQYCKTRFDRDKIPFVEVATRRYAHKKCRDEYEANLTQEEKDKINLENYIKEKIPNAAIPKVRIQIEKFKKEYNYTYSGMLKTLIYHYEVKNGDVTKANGGIGIVPYIYMEAREYYKNIDLQKQTNREKNIQEYVPKVVEITIRPPQRKTSFKKSFFSFLDEQE